MKKLIGACLVGALVGVGCSSQEGAGAGEVYAETALEIGEPSCATASTDRSVTGEIFLTLSPTTYSNPACYKAWVLGISDFGRFATVFVNWVTPPTTQSECEAAYVRADLYRDVNGTFEKIDQHSADGRWNGQCSVFTAVQAPAAAGTYKLAATGRTTSSSSAPTRRLRVWSQGPGGGPGF
jgi:hypothetical protein